MAASEIPAKIKKALYDRDEWRCRHCKNRNGLHPHHIIYRSHGGEHTLENLITLCWKCHSAVHDGFLRFTSLPGGIFFERVGGWKP